MHSFCMQDMADLLTDPAKCSHTTPYFSCDSASVELYTGWSIRIHSAQKVLINRFGISYGTGKQTWLFLSQVKCDGNRRSPKVPFFILFTYYKAMTLEIKLHLFYKLKYFLFFTIISKKDKLKIVIEIIFYVK